MKNLTDMDGLFNKAVREDEDVNYVHKDEAVEKVPEEVVHKSLDYHCGIDEAEGIERYSKWPRGV